MAIYVKQSNSCDKLSISLLDVYPVGAIYMSTSSTNPGSIFGGTWEAWGSGRVPVGVNTNDGDFNSANKTGGSKTVNLAHSHTVNGHTHTSAAHTHSLNNDSACALIGRSTTSLHTISYKNGGSRNGLQYDRQFEIPKNSANVVSNIAGGSWKSNDVTSLHGNTNSTTPGATGSSSPGTNSKLSGSQSILQPYITCYMFRRTA